MNSLVDCQDPLNPQVLILWEAAHGNIMAESKCQIYSFSRDLAKTQNYSEEGHLSHFPLTPSPLNPTQINERKTEATD